MPSQECEHFNHLAAEVSVGAQRVVVEGVAPLGRTMREALIQADCFAISEN